MVQKEEEKTAEKVSRKVITPVNTKIKSTSILSIKDFLESSTNEKEEDSTIDSSQKSKDEFKEEEVKLFWNQYLQNLKNKQPVLYNVLNSTSCQLKENFTVFFQFPSNSAYEEFENLRENFFQKLKKQVNNYSISFSYEIKETQKSILLSPKDKYEKMLKSNPLLERLKNDFRLDI